ncbi:hypothetical protein niasHS_007476 [Heterodera schachtii]|uniref:Ig-like domain-containing protein n=1 Tax=Heterodera schachtii TaxID=97005 RepID=A0ABD2JXL1_HETSC
MPLPLPVLPLFVLLTLLRLPLLFLLLPHLVPSSPSVSPPSLQFHQQIRICPLKCQCSQDGSSIACSDLSRADLRHLFGSGTSLSFIHRSQFFSFVSLFGGTPSGQQFASTLLNLSIVRSQLDSLDILPPMERLMWLDLRENKLEKVETLRVEKSFFSFADRRMTSHFMPAFPALVFVDLSQNLITSISRHSFIAFPNAEEIRLTANRIVSVEWEAFRLFRLRRLSLSANCLLTISEHILRFSPAIEELDLSHNHLASAQSSSFFAAQHLRLLNLSHNRLHKFDYDSFSPLFQLESLDLSWNNFTATPPDIRQFVALRMLNFSGNPIEKIAEGEMAQPMLQTLQICDCHFLRLVERRAFAALPNLQFLRLANNPKLQFVSPGAFSNNSLLFEVDFSNNSLSTLSPNLLLLPVRLHLSSNPFFCGCVSSWMPNIFQKITDLNEAICVSSAEGENQRRISMAKIVEGQNIGQRTGECPREPILPMGKEFRTNVGQFFSLYCAPRMDRDGGKGGNGEGKEGGTEWTMPNGTKLIGDEQRQHGSDQKETKDESAKNGAAATNASSAGDPIEVRPSSPPTDQSADLRRRVQLRSPPVFSSPLFDSPFLGSVHPSLFQLKLNRPSPSMPISTNGAQMPRPKSRIQADGEQLRFEVLVSEDSGNYTCHVNGAVVVLRLLVEKPVIELSAVEIGSHYVALAWNDSLKIRAAERVHLSLEVRDAITQQRRTIQLSLHNPWRSYNVVRLRPLTNYTFCLEYHLVHFPLHLADSSSIFKTCIDVQTEEPLGFWTSLSPISIGILLAFCFCLSALLCFRALYLRFYIWHEAKLRARMNQSMSGQSFLSRSSSLHHSVQQQLNSAQSANGIATRPSASSSSSNFTSIWEERSSPAQCLQTPGNEKRVKKKRKDKTTALRLGAKKSADDDARGDGEGMGVAESIVLC